jgi:hypothetical protein
MSGLANESLRAAEITKIPSDGFDFIFIEGEIRAGDYQEFNRVAAESDSAIVVLGSEGGLIRPAMSIGRLVKARRFVTFVPSNTDCLSACATIWVAGEKRLMAKSGRVGFHAVYDGRSMLESGEENAVIGRYLALLGFGEGAVRFMTRAGPDRFAWLSEEKGRELGINFVVVPDTRRELDEPETETVASGGPKDEVREDAPANQPDEPRYAKEDDTVSDWTNESDGNACVAKLMKLVEDGIENRSGIEIRSSVGSFDSLVTFQNERFRSLRERQIYFISLSFIGDDGKIFREMEDLRMIGVTGERGMPGLQHVFSGNDFHDNVSRSSAVGLTMSGRFVDLFQIAGSAGAMEEFADCRGIDALLLDDPFAQ